MVNLSKTSASGSASKTAGFNTHICKELESQVVNPQVSNWEYRPSVRTTNNVVCAVKKSTVFVIKEKVLIW